MTTRNAKGVGELDMHPDAVQARGSVPGVVKGETSRGSMLPPPPGEAFR